MQMETFNPIAAMRRFATSARGFSVTEIMTVLTAASTLTAVAAPSVEDYVSQARTIKAVSDVRTVQVAVLRLTSDVPVSERRAKGWSEMVLMVGDGETPAIAPSGASEWALPVDGSGHVGRIVDELVTNDTGYATSPVGGRNAGGWRGPYIDGPVGADPWGHRIAVNVQWLNVGTRHDTVVLSAGPDGIVETAFAKDGLLAAGDDIVALVASGN
jgi:hypothetical protein